MGFFNKLSFFVVFFLFYPKCVWSQPLFVETENEQLSYEIKEHFKNKNLSPAELNQFLIENGYYLAEATQRKNKIIIKNPYQIIFIIKGNKAFNEREIRRLLQIDENKQGFYFYNFIANQIRSAYQEKGFFKMSIEKKETQKGWKKWYYLTISEGNIMRLGALRVMGLLSRPFSFYKKIILENSPELSKGFFNKRALEESQNFLINYLKNEGYLQAQVYSSREFFKDDKVFITIRLEEGPLSFITDIQIRGMQSFAFWEILSEMESRIQSRVIIDVIKRDLKKIENLYRGKGYLQMKIKNKKNVVQYLKGEKDVTLIIEIEEGSAFFISRIDLKGLKKVKKSLVEGLLEFKIGGVFTEEKEEESLQKLARTGLFENISINEKIIDEKLEIDVLFQEKKSRSIKGGLGINSQRNLTTHAYTELTHRNLFGWGRAFIMKGSGQVSLTQRTPFLEYDLSTRYKEVFIPSQGYEGNMSLSLSKNIFKYSSADINFVEKTLLNFFINKKITDIFNLRWTVLSFENRTEVCASGGCSSKPQRISSTSFQAVFDKRNNILNPSEGYSLSYMMEWASPILGSSLDIAFLKFDFYSDFYLNFLSNYTLSFVLKTGFMSIIQENGYMPVSRTFILGGQGSLRGYDGNIEGARLPRKKHAPIETANESLKLKLNAGRKTEETVLKNQYNLLKVDFIFPVFEGFKGVLFYDLGTIYLESENKKLLDYGHSIGLGLRYQTVLFPIPIGVDIAYQLPPRECIQLNGGCNYSKFHFSIGW